MVGAPQQRKRTVGAKRQQQAEVDPKRFRRMTHSLVRWYAANHRKLPWRVACSPYATWVSEIMLQQTQVATVIPYFERWMDQFPTVGALARANEDAVFAIWQGLGYYSRARNLHRAAQLVVKDFGGNLPTEAGRLRQLPGIGRYTAGAIASIAFDQPEAAVDGNVMRVISRIEALPGDPRVEPHASRIWELASEWVRYAKPSWVNQGLMELGALICTPRQPRCGQCPAVEDCRARIMELVDKLPELQPRPKPETRHVVVILSKAADKVLVVRQPDEAAHWSSLFVFPYAEHPKGQTPLEAARQLVHRLDPKARLIRTAPMFSLTYPITRFRFHASVFLASPVRIPRRASPEGHQVSPSEFTNLAVPAPHRRIFKRWSAAQ